MKNKKGFIIASIIMIIIICVAFTTKTLQNDTFYNIKLGESILKHGVDLKEHFTWHENLKTYSYPHWLFDVISYKVYDLGGIETLYTGSIILFIIIGLTFFFMNIKLNKSYFLSLLFSIIGIIMLARFITPRAQLLTYLLFLVEVLCIEKLLQTNKKRYGISLILICILIANIHAPVWPFYFVLMLPYIFEYIVKLITDKIKNKPKLGIFENKIELKKEENIKGLFIIFIISLFLGLLTPGFFTPYTYFIKIMMGNTMEYIDEHKALILIENLFVIGYILIMFIPLIFTKVKIRLSDLSMLLGLLLMAFISKRHVALLGVIGMFYLCRLICNIGKIKNKKPLDFYLPWYGLFIVTMTIVITSGIVFSINSKEPYINEDNYPVQMVKYMKKNLNMKEVRLYNEYDFGSYLIYKNIPVYIDSRSDIYTKPFNHKFDIFDECMNITTNYGRVFKKYKITHILTYKDTDLNQILAASPNYELVHKEGRFTLYKYLGNEEETKKEEKSK